MISTRALAVFAALCLVGRLVWDAWQRRRWARAVEGLHTAARAAFTGSGYPLDGTAEGLGGTGRRSGWVRRYEPSCAVPTTDLDASALRALHEIGREAGR